MSDLTNQLSQTVDQALALCDQIEEADCWILSDKISMRKLLLNDLLAFCMYLCCSDGTIKSVEAAYIREVLGYDVTPADIKAYVDGGNLYSTKFESEIPLILRGVFFAGEQLKEKGVEGDLLGYFIDIYKAVGTGLVGIDGALSDGEKADCAAFIRSLTAFKETGR